MCKEVKGILQGDLLSLKQDFYSPVDMIQFTIYSN